MADVCSTCGSSALPCSQCGVVVDAATGRTVPAPGVCAPGPGNLPVSDSAYQNSLGVCLQDVVDQARHIQHELGLRPYRVTVLWLRRDRQQRFSEVVRSLELVPVQISSLASVDRPLGPSGANVEGEILLTEISPTQADYDTLLGKLEGEDPPDDVSFFYEIQQMPRCSSSTPIAPGRYAPSSIPYFDAEQFQWVIGLTAQQQPRDSADVADRDQTFTPARVRRPRSLLRT